MIVPAGRISSRVVARANKLAETHSARVKHRDFGDMAGLLVGREAYNSERYVSLLKRNFTILWSSWVFRRNFFSGPTKNSSTAPCQLSVNSASFPVDPRMKEYDLLRVTGLV